MSSRFTSGPRWTRSLLSAAVISAFAAPALANTISGKIVDKNGQPIANATIELNESKMVKTDTSGNFSFDKVSIGKSELHIKADSFSHVTQNVTVTEQGLNNLNVTLSPTVLEVIDVYATPLHASSIESALPINVLAGDELASKQAATLGETLKYEVGVHSSYFGPNSSSPIIRGLDGPRVMITQNGLDVSDVSRVGADHVVTTETATATQVEVLRGPATLFYGSGAIGGVVNVVDTRVPTSSETQLDYRYSFNSVADENAGSINFNTGTENFAFHVDGYLRDSDDYDIPTDEEVLENSSAEADGFTIGSSYLLDNGFIGFSYGEMNNTYGIPGHSHGEEHHDEDEDHDDEDEEHHEEDEHHDDEEHEEETVFADMKQKRFQLLSELSFDEQFINRLAAKFAYTDYQHVELENGEVGTTFKSDSTEARVDLYHREVNGFKGAWTIHYKSTDFEASGEEAFTPPSKTDTFAVAWLEEKHLNHDVLMQLGLRAERVDIEAEHGDEIPSYDFTPLSASLGFVWDYQPGYNLGFSMSVSQRAPSAAELYSNGPHIGTGTYEVGAIYDVEMHDDHIDVELSGVEPDIETSKNIDVTWRKFEGDFGFVISGFYNQIDNYYYLDNTGLFAEFAHDDHDEDEHHEDEEHHDEDEHHEDEEGHEEQHGEELPVYAYRQADVTLLGFESEFIYRINDSLMSKFFADYIHASFDDREVGKYLPRIPPMRAGLVFDYQSERFDTKLGITHYFEQDNVAELETTTDAYTLVDVNFNYYIEGVGNDLVLFAKGENLLDEEARVHSSFIKEEAPLPGRGFVLGVRGSF
ncbi:TonB-dependent receptor [Thalassotalea eurytherma]|uniref:Outer membrane protein n=1 Tax=Thalassotalea eurytherma TaxID=1144278 RepID=A0ABQ6H6J2_9GAMM|nr:TonB-dependent receptor [Thalassotalea eurytherma]GLX83109.1 outer membrane protein [Thalassotalea eurytherma]